MGIELRLALVIGALVTMIFFLRQIRKSRLQIPYAISWSVLCALILFISIFPGPVIWISALLGFQSPANLVYLAVIFVLIIMLFSTTTKLSRMDRQINDLAQHIALNEAAPPKGEDPPAET